MRSKQSVMLSIVIAILFSLVPFGYAQEESSDPFTGSFLGGYRWVDVSGIETKYQQHFNLDDGGRLFNLHLSYAPMEESARNFVELMDVEANNLGGDPFETFRVNVRKSRTYNFTYQHIKSTYFYEDIQPMTDVRLSDGDTHFSDFRRYRDFGTLKIWVTDALRLNLGFNRFEKIGDRETSLDIVHDEFDFDKPIDEIRNEYTASIEYDLNDRFTLGLQETIQNYTNANSLFLPGASAGTNTTNTAQLNSFVQDQPYDFDSYAHTIRLNARPVDKLTIAAAATFETLDMSVDYAERADGTSYAAGAPHYSEDITGAGSITRDIQLYDVDASFALTDRLALIGAVRYRNFAQDGDMTVESEENASTWDYSIIGVEGGMQFQVSAPLVVAAGIRHETRKIERTITEAGTSDSETPDDTKLLGAFGTVNWQVIPALRLTADYQLRSADAPFTMTSPTDHHRLRIRANYKMDSGFSVMGSYLLHKFENEDADWTADQNQANLQVGYQRDNLALSLGYGLIQVKRDIDQSVAMGTATVDFPTLYEGKTNLVSGQVRFAVNPQITLGGDVNYYDNKETEPVKQLNLRSYVELTVAKNYLVNLGYRYVDFQEDDGMNDYSANIAEFSVGYKWGK